MNKKILKEKYKINILGNPNNNIIKNKGNYLKIT